MQMFNVQLQEATSGISVQWCNQYHSISTVAKAKAPDSFPDV